MELAQLVKKKKLSLNNIFRVLIYKKKKKKKNT